MKLPPAFPVTTANLHAIAERFALNPAPCGPLDSVGIINSIYQLGPHHLVRVPRNHVLHLVQGRRESIAIPAAVAAGVRTGNLVARDEQCDLVPVPYAIVERLSGRDMESLGGCIQKETLRELGRDLARLHMAPIPEELEELPLDEYETFMGADPRTYLRDRVSDGWISSFEAEWLEAWIAQLAAAGAAAPAQKALVHADVQMTNVIVDEDGTYVGLIDWGCARVGYPAADFHVVPMNLVSEILVGYREIDPQRAEGFEARILWHRLQSQLAVMPRGAARDLAWAERPIGAFLDLLHFFLQPVDAPWRPFGPKFGGREAP